MSEDIFVACGDIIHEMLGLDPGMLAVMSPSDDTGNDRALLGLGKVVRRSYEISLQLRDRKNLVLRLKSNDDQARAWGYGDAAAANIGMLLVWAVLRPYRYDRGHRYAPVLVAEENVIDLPPRADAGLRALTNAQIIDRLYDVKASAVSHIDATTPDDVKGASIWELTKKLLGLHGADLARVFYDTVNDMVPDLVEKPEQTAGNGLVYFVRGIAAQYDVMRERDVRKIQLRTDQDAVEAGIPGGAKAANLMTVLAASLFADKKHSLTFVAPRERSDEEKEFLRGVARWVYLHFNHQVFDGLEFLFEGNRHFGTMGKIPLASQLLHEVRLDVDPKLERMPTFVRFIEMGLTRPSQIFRWQQAS